jgi:hypothetical protein
MMSAAMRSRHRLRLLSLVALVALALAACDSSDDPLASHRPTFSPLPSGTETPHGAPDLEARLPDSIGGTALVHSSFDGQSFLATGTDANRTALQGMLGGLGRRIEDLSLAQATDPANNLPFVEGIFRVAGTPPDRLEPAWIAAQETATDNRLVQGTVSIGGRSVTKLSDPNLPSGGTTYVVPSGDALVLILADDTKLVEEALGKIR